MDSITSLLRKSRKHDSIMVVIDRLSKVVHFIPVKNINSTSEIAQIFIREIVILHGIPKKIISDRYAKFISRFWKDLFASLGIELAFITSYQLQTYG